MAELLQQMLNFVAAHSAWAYAVVFLFALAEASPIVGTVVPGSPVILAISALVPSGAVELWPLIGWALAGAVGGDVIAYTLGRRHHRGILARWPFSRYPQLFSHGQAYFQRHGQKSVFLSRFVRGPHAVVPLVAGIMHMRLRPFLVMNIASAVIWSLLHTLPGVLVGASLALASAVAGRLVVFILVLAVTLWLLVWVVRAVLRRGLPWLDRAQNGLWRWAQAHPNRLGRALIALLDPHEREVRVLVLSGVLMIAATASFVWVLEGVLTGDPLVRADVAVYHFLQGLRTTWGDQIMIRVTELGDSLMTTSLTVAVALWLAWRRAWRAMVYWILAVSVAGLFSTTMKVVFEVPRPEDIYTGWSAFSFPSTHAVVNSALYGFFAVLVGREISPRWRGVLAAATAAWIGAMAFSRVYLGAHWLSDVLGGLAFSIAWVTLLGIVYTRRPASGVGPAGMVATLLLALAIVGTWHVTHSFAQDTERYAVTRQVRILPAAQWWHGGWRLLPPRRVDLTGEFSQPIRMQWSGLLIDLKQQLTATGWHTPIPWTWRSALNWFLPAPGPAKLPVLTHLHDGQPPDLTLVHELPPREGQPRRAVLRLWQSPWSIRTPLKTTYPVWLATISQQRLVRPFSLMTLTPERSDAGLAFQLLADAVHPDKVVRRTVRPPNQSKQDRWGGHIILAHDPTLSVDGPVVGP